MRAGEALARKNLVVNAEEIRSLRRKLDTATESEAVRIAVRERLAVEDAVEALLRIRRRGGIEDVLGRSTPRRKSR